jgi:short-subunit dehydrogenase
MATALITGASAGIGTELAKLFAADGHSVILVARREERLLEIAKEIEAMGVKAWVVSADLALPGSAKKLFERVNEIGCDVEFLVNNAGFGIAGHFAKQPLARELEMIDLNIRALTEITHLFLPTMLKRRSGRILNVGSTAGFQPGPNMTVYYASKAYVNSFSEALHEELAGTGVSCTILAPGPTETEFAAVAGLSDSNLFKNALTATALKVAEDGYRAMMKGKALKISGSMNAMQVQGLRLMPRGIVRKIAARLNQN